MKAHASRLLEEATEAADYALAALDQRSRPAALVDLERLDAALRALRYEIQRESPFYLPEPWPVRLPARLAILRKLRRESHERTRKQLEGLEEIAAKLWERGFDIDFP